MFIECVAGWNLKNKFFLDKKKIAIYFFLMHHEGLKSYLQPSKENTSKHEISSLFCPALFCPIWRTSQLFVVLYEGHRANPFLSLLKVASPALLCPIWRTNPALCYPIWRTQAHRSRSVVPGGQKSSPSLSYLRIQFQPCSVILEDLGLLFFRIWRTVILCSTLRKQV